MSTDAPGSAGPDRTVVLDIDGTLVDSAYLHVHAWSRAFHQVGLDVPSHRIHGAIGMGGDRIVAHLAGEAAEHSIGDDVRARHDELFESVLGDVRPTRGCTDLLQALRDRGLRLVVASSANASVTDALLEAAGASTYVAKVTTGDDVGRSKPHRLRRLSDPAAAGPEARPGRRWRRGPRGRRRRGGPSWRRGRAHAHRCRGVRSPARA